MTRATLALAVTAAMLLLDVAGPSVASAWCRMTSSRRLPTFDEPCIFPDLTTDPPEQYLEWWRPCSTVTLSVTSPSSTMTDAEVIGVLGRSVATWEAVECEPGVRFGIDIEVQATRNTCDAPLYRDGGGNTNGVMFVWDWMERRYDGAAFAVTTVWHRRSTGEILDADMEINERRGPYGICPDEGCIERIVDLENVVTHEMGHYLGLAHSEDVDATMYASAVAGETIKRSVEADDIEGLCTIYPPGQPEGECDYAARGGDDFDCEEGCSVGGPGRRNTPTWPLALIALVMGRALVSRRRS